MNFEKGYLAYDRWGRPGGSGQPRTGCGVRLTMLPRPVQRTLLILGALLAALLFFIGGAALRLLMGPISLGPFASIIEDALNHSVSGVVIRFDQAGLEWSRAEGKVNLIVLGTKVVDLDCHIVAHAPKTDLAFHAP